MRDSMTVITVLAAAALLVSCGGSTDGDPGGGNTGTSPGESARAPEGGVEAVGEENPWLLGYRWTGTPGTQFYVKRYMTGSLGTMDDGSKHGVGDRQLAFLLRREMTGLRIEVRIESRGESELEIEIVKGRPKDPNNPIGEIEYRKVLDSGKVSGFKGKVVLSGGDPIPEK